MGATRKPGILIVDNSVAITGALKAIITATLHLKDDFNFLYVLPEKSAALPYLESLDLKYATLPFVEISKSPANLVKYFPFLFLNGVRLRNLARQHQAKIIHMNDFYNLTGIIAKQLGAKVQLVTHVRFLPQKFMPALANIWAKLNLQFAAKIICVSQAVKVFFQESEKIQLISDPLPETEKHPEKHVSGNETGLIRLLYLSNFIRGKGQDHALKAFREAYQQNPEIRLNFIGGDMGLEKNRQFKLELEHDVKASGLEGIITFESFAEDVEAKIKAADIVLNFSESESFSLTCLDALYFGTPLIASDCGGPAELFENGKSGLLVPNLDEPAMKEAILKLAANRTLQQNFAAAGKKYVHNKFKPENTYIALGALYKQLAN